MSNKKDKSKRRDMSGKSMFPKFDWQKLLDEWSIALLASDDLNEKPPQAVIDNKWFGYPGAIEEQIVQAEERLGAKLPPSYREFLKVTNGWEQLTSFIYKMWPVEEVEWFKVRNEDWITVYDDPDLELTITDEEYFVYGEEQDSVSFRREYLETALEISERGDSGIFLLNPQVVTPEGEWEAWFFANWLPGATRYRSFWEMMQAEYQSFVELEKNDNDD